MVYALLAAGGNVLGALAASRRSPWSRQALASMLAL
jgi:hypothetical protein